jgi:hypothetical protein
MTKTTAIPWDAATWKFASYGTAYSSTYAGKPYVYVSMDADKSGVAMGKAIDGIVLGGQHLTAATLVTRAVQTMRSFNTTYVGMGCQ